MTETRTKFEQELDELPLKDLERFACGCKGKRTCSIRYTTFRQNSPLQQYDVCRLKYYEERLR